MKLLRRRHKVRIRQGLVKSRLRPVLAGLYRSVLGTELALHRLAARRAADPHDLSDVTVVIKTFERPLRCQALIDSICAQHPAIRIVVVDDSERPVSFESAETIALPFDSGVSAGRNAGLAAVETPFFLNLDDDFVFYRGTGLAAAVSLLRELPVVGIMGGAVTNLPFYRRNRSLGRKLYPVEAASLVEPGTRIGSLQVSDKVSNFFLGRTEAVRRVGWDPRLKRLDHADFFTRAKGRLVSVHNPALRVLHANDPFDVNYLSFRYDLSSDGDYLTEKYGLDRVR